jgi:protein involved in polysaccharide export with SLBB domain
MAILVTFCGCGSGPPPVPPAYTTPPTEDHKVVPEMDAYIIMVDDELSLMILGSPELSGPARVLPDGTITVPGVGSVYVLGMTLSEATEKINSAMSEVVRFPKTSIAVTRLGTRRIFLMGEVVIPGDHEHHRGMTALSAIAEAGGFKEAGKKSSVMILRRLGPDNAVAYRVDLRDALEGKSFEQDLPVKPFDIIYVPKTFIASVNVLMDQYFRQLTPPFSLYMAGWQALNLGEDTVQIVGF